MIMEAFHDSLPRWRSSSAVNGPIPCPAIRIDLCHIHPVVVRPLTEPLQAFDSIGARFRYNALKTRSMPYAPWLDLAGVCKSQWPARPLPYSHPDTTASRLSSTGFQ